RGRLVLALRTRPFRLRLDVVRRVLRIGYPAAIEHLLMQIGFFIYIVFAAHHGTAAVAAYFIGVRILSLSFLPGFGFAAAAATMIGQNLGAERPGAGAARFPLATVFLGFYVCRLGFAWLVTFALGLGVVWLWLALVGDYVTRSLLKGARFRSGVWKTVAV